MQIEFIIDSDNNINVSYKTDVNIFKCCIVFNSGQWTDRIFKLYGVFHGQFDVVRISKEDVQCSERPSTTTEYYKSIQKSHRKPLKLNCAYTACSATCYP